jgi:hypothetical protein
VTKVFVLYEALDPESPVGKAATEFTGFTENAFGLETDNFLLVYADETGLHRLHSGPGPWEQVIAQMGDEVPGLSSFLNQFRHAELSEEDDGEQVWSNSEE